MRKNDWNIVFTWPNHIIKPVGLNDIFFVYNVIQNSCCFFLKKVAALYELSSQRVLSAVGAYWNPWNRDTRQDEVATNNMKMGSIPTRTWLTLQNMKQLYLKLRLGILHNPLKGAKSKTNMSQFFVSVF